MTRLTTEDLIHGPNDLTAYDKQLKRITGLGLLDLALKTSDMTLDQYGSRAESLSRVAVIPLTIGRGVISDFSEKVAELGCYLGLPCRVTKARDVEGWGEAVAGGCEMIICADDKTFLALNLVSRRVVENGAATGAIYAVALSAAAGGVAERPVGVLGLGPVGRAAVNRLREQGARIIVYERDQEKQTDFLSNRNGIRGMGSVDEVIKETDLVLDATNTSDLIRVSELERRLTLSAPGVPLGVDDPDSVMVQLIHDPLQLGVAAMMVQALA